MIMQVMMMMVAMIEMLITTPTQQDYRTTVLLLDWKGKHDTSWGETGWWRWRGDGDDEVMGVTGLQGKGKDDGRGYGGYGGDRV